jgi:hypothetical protein
MTFLPKLLTTAARHQGLKAELERVENAKADYLRQSGAYAAKALALGKATVRRH